MQVFVDASSVCSWSTRSSLEPGSLHYSQRWLDVVLAGCLGGVVVRASDL